MLPVIVLLDLDGVLIKPGGYRAAVTRSLEFLIERLGLKVPAPDTTVPALFEAQGISTEWDMVPISYAIVLNALAEHIGQTLPPLNLDGVSQWVRSLKVNDFQVDYRATVGRLSAYTTMQIMPSLRLLESIERGAGAALFPHLDHQPFVRELLGDTRDVATSLTMRLVQNFVLGEQVFRETYHREVEVVSQSLLRELDQPAIERETVERLLQLRSQGALFPCCYTARPSLPPADSGADRFGYSPEAELALDLVGLADIPLIGYGSLQWLGKETGVVADSLLKPKPAQALAVIYAAWTGKEAEGLRWAARLAEKAASGGSLSGMADGLPEQMELHVFEDTATGLIAVQRAADILRDCGLRIEVRTWGISANPYKLESLRATGASLFPDVNEAMRAAFAER